MARLLHIVLVGVLMLQYSPLCACVLDHVISGATHAAGDNAGDNAGNAVGWGGASHGVFTRTNPVPHCLAEQSGRHEGSCVCVDSTKTATAATGVSLPADCNMSLQSPIAFVDQIISYRQTLADDSAEPPDPFAAQSLPRLN